jgi:hypothetical protein
MPDALLLMPPPLAGEVGERSEPGGGMFASVSLQRTPTLTLPRLRGRERSVLVESSRAH